MKPIAVGILTALLRPLAYGLRVSSAFAVWAENGTLSIAARHGPLPPHLLESAAVRHALGRAVTVESMRTELPEGVGLLAAARLWVGTDPVCLFVADSEPRRLDDPEVAHLVATATDAQTAIESAAERSEREYGALLDDVAIGVMLQDPDGRIVGCNDAVLDLIGSSRDALLGRTMGETGFRAIREDGTPFAPEEHPAALARATGQHVRNVVVGFEKSGELRWHSVSARCRFRRGAPTPHFVVLTSFDITNEKRAEDARRDSEERYRQIFTYGLDGIVFAEPGERVLAVNPAACRMFGRTEAEILAMGCSALVDASDPSYELFLDTLAASGVARGELRLKRTDGTLFTAEVESVTFKDARGRIRTCASVRDISERRELERRLAAAETRLRERVAVDLHDRIGQLVVGARLMADNLVSIATPGMAPPLVRIAGALSEATTEIRSLASNLATAWLDDTTLGQALAALAERARAAYGVDCVYVQAGAERDPPLFVKQHVVLFAEEALSNALRHGRCSHVELRYAPGSTCSLRVVDDGVGIPERPTEGLGLPIMRRRGELLAGSAFVRALPAGRHGTEAVLTWPCNAA